MGWRAVVTAYGHLSAGIKARHSLAARPTTPVGVGHPSSTLALCVCMCSRQGRAFEHIGYLPVTKRGGYQRWQAHSMPDMEGARHVGRVPWPGGWCPHLCRCATTQATRWSAHARTLGLAHARALGRCSTFAAADHTEARDPAPRAASPGRARTVARRCTRVRVRVGGAGRMRVRAPSAESGVP